MITEVLGDVDLRPWSSPDKAFTAEGYALGKGQYPLEVAVVRSGKRPTAMELRHLWKARHQGKPSPLLLVALHTAAGGQHVSLCGVAGDDPRVAFEVDAVQADSLVRAALAERDRNSAIRYLTAALEELHSELPGLRNEGMLATHELVAGVPTRGDWAEACVRAIPLLGRSGRELVEALGFSAEARGSATWVLRGQGQARAVAVFLDQSETPDSASLRFGGTTPVSYALALADSEGLPYVVLTRSRQIRIYGARPNTGVGRKGRSETFVEANLALLGSERCGYLPLLFGADALLPGGSFEQIMEASRDYAVDLGVRLRERVYSLVVPALARALAGSRRVSDETTPEGLTRLYSETLFILFRLLFLAYAEARDLLPYASNDRYRARSLKALARELADSRNAGGLVYDKASVDLWERARGLWAAIDQGNKGWGVPAYNGGLFSSDPSVSDVGAALAEVQLNDEEFGHPLFDLFIDQAVEGNYGPVDFRTLSVREFGTIYEGLLESELSIAPTDLALDSEGAYVPAGKGVEVVVRSGDVYLHNRSGARKSLASFFTKAPLVEHLLDQALEPALDEHLGRLRRLIADDDQAGAASAFFDFRCVDLAMGSGHFLVAAVDRIEARLSTFLAQNPIPGVLGELQRLHQSALEALGPLGASYEIETASLLRRQVARRCVYGVDLNGIAVELARLSLWIHTFVPGLPLSFLNHNLIAGDSLTGLASVDKAVEILAPTDKKGGSFTEGVIHKALEQASGDLMRLARISDANAREIAEARSAVAAARTSVEPAEQLMDLALSVRLGHVDRPLLFGTADITADLLRAGSEVAATYQGLHFPVIFPEVFMRADSGFDVILGNPPYDKVRFEAQQFWLPRAPGLNGLSASQRDAEIGRLRATRPVEAALETEDRKRRERLQMLIDRCYDLQGRGSHGHHDLAKLFLERALGLLASRGRLGFVMPRTALVLGGWGDLRAELFDGHSSTVLQGRNRGGWLFEDVHYQLMFGLISRGPTDEDHPAGVRIWPAVTSQARLNNLSDEPGIFLSEGELAELTDVRAVPWFSTAQEPAVFEHMRREPRLGAGAGWITAAADSSRWDFSGSGLHHQYVSDRASAGSWRVLMTRHVDPFRIAENVAFTRFVPHPAGLAGLKLGISIVDGSAEITGEHPPIVFRYPTMNDNSRTVIATALPSNGFIYSKGYVHGLRVPQGTTTRDILALLAYLNSFTCDWWARRFTDRHVTLRVMNNIPLPQWDDQQRTDAADCATALLVHGGTSQIAGGVDLKVPRTVSGLDQDELLVRIERLAQTGFGLMGAQMATVLADFTDNGCPPRLRQLLTAALI